MSKSVSIMGAEVEALPGQRTGDTTGLLFSRMDKADGTS